MATEKIAQRVDSKSAWDSGTSEPLEPGESAIVVEGGTKINKGSTAAQFSAIDGYHTPSFEGMIAAFATTTAPSGWLSANGAAVSRSTYANLFAAIGTTWGSGDGSTTFNLPDLRGMFLSGAGTNGGFSSPSYDGPAVGTLWRDQMQQITGDTGNAGLRGPSGSSWTGSGAINAGVFGPGTYKIGTNGGERLVFDSANSTAAGGARTGTTTHPQTAGVLYCVKY